MGSELSDGRCTACNTCDGGGGYESKLYRIGHPDSQTGGHGYTISTQLGGTIFLDDHNRLIDGQTLKRIPPPPSRKYPADMARLARDGRFVFSTSSCGYIDTVTHKQVGQVSSETSDDWEAWSFPASQPIFMPKFGSIAMAGTEVRILPALERLNIPPALLQLWAQVAVRGELGQEGEFVKWDEASWEKKRQELAAAKPPYPDFPFPGYVATDKLHWLRAEYVAADEKDKLRRATELLHERSRTATRAKPSAGGRKWPSGRKSLIRRNGK